MALIGFQEGGTWRKTQRTTAPGSRIGRRDRCGLRTFHDPVEVRPSATVQVVTVVGSEEADVVHAAAGGWLNDHHDAVVIGINWYGHFLSPYEDDDGGDPPRHRMDLTVGF